MTATATLTITAFLEQRIAEDEAAARAASVESPSPWRWTDDSEPTLRDAEGMAFAHASYDGDSLTPDRFAHIARHDPAHVLAGCEARRAIVELGWHHLGEDEYADGMEYAKEQVLRLMAGAYKDHADYNADWA